MHEDSPVSASYGIGGDPIYYGDSSINSFISSPSDENFSSSRFFESDGCAYDYKAYLHSSCFDILNNRFVSPWLYVLGAAALFFVLFAMVGGFDPFFGDGSFGSDLTFKLLVPGVPSTLLLVFLFSRWFPEHREYKKLSAERDADLAVTKRLSSIPVVEEAPPIGAKLLCTAKGERKYVVFFGQAEDSRRTLVGARAGLLLDAEKAGANAVFNFKMTVYDNTVVYSGQAAIV